MKLRIKNLAKIKNATIDIKPLTIFIGPNGTGKTWAAYAFYSLIKQLRRSISLDTDIDLKKVTPRNFVKELETQARKITERIQEAKLGTSLEMKFDQNDIDLQVPKILKLSIKSEDMANLMLTNSQIFEKTQVDLELDQSDFKTNPKDALVIKTNDRYIETILGSESVIIPRSLQKEFSQTFFRSRLETVIFKLFVGRREQVIPFPSERKALLLLY
ncbi:MAG: AAA family ATPase, partial [Blastocatellia bacterium]|nr:AAA family ATPase [Blastocatellia bacterium]